ncbi:MAG: DUF4375 domain-containing protein [Pseudomonadota bacterium]
MSWSFSREPNRKYSAVWKDEFWPPDEWYLITEEATENILMFWHWDNPRHSKKMAKMLTEEQVLLWAVENIVGQICNGGFHQALHNSYGELAEEGLLGLRKFGLDPFADIVERAWEIFGIRPIPRDRDERNARLDALTEMDDLSAQSDPVGVQLGDVKGSTRDHFYKLEDQFYELLHAEPRSAGYDAAYYRPLAEWIYQHRDRFFMDAQVELSKRS